jgi:periplasmic protein TonB
VERKYDADADRIPEIPSPGRGRKAGAAALLTSVCLHALAAIAVLAAAGGESPDAPPVVYVSLVSTAGTEAATIGPSRAPDPLPKAYRGAPPQRAAAKPRSRVDRPPSSAAGPAPAAAAPRPVPDPSARRPAPEPPSGTEPTGSAPSGGPRAAHAAMAPADPGRLPGPTGPEVGDPAVAEPPGPSKAAATSGGTPPGADDRTPRGRSFGYIGDAIQRGVSYPIVARKMGWEGRVVVAFRILPDGSVRNVRVVQGSGYPVLDRSAVEAVRSASPFPRPPKAEEIETPVLYKLY